VLQRSVILALFNFFSKKVSVYTAFNNETYFKVAQAFQNEGLSFKVKRLSNSSSVPGSHFNVNDFKAATIYEFYVKKEELNKAQKILSTLVN
jgi:hypothetical protein